MNTIREIQTLNKRELENAVSPNASWHTDYRDTAYIYIGGLAFELTEGDVITIFSQYGEPVWLKLARDRETGKSKGFAWLKYEDQRSTDLAVDNLGGATVLGRKLKVDHARYKKRDDEDDDKFNISFTAAKADPEDSDLSAGSTSASDSEAEEHKRKVSKDAITMEHEEEDPMKEYLARERRERRKHRHGSRERSNHHDRKHRHHRHHHSGRHHSRRHHPRERE